MLYKNFFKKIKVMKSRNLDTILEFTERRIVASNGGYVKPQPTGQIHRTDAPPQMFFEKG